LLLLSRRLLGDQTNDQGRPRMQLCDRLREKVHQERVLRRLHERSEIQRELQFFHFTRMLINVFLVMEKVKTKLVSVKNQKLWKC